MDGVFENDYEEKKDEKSVSNLNKSDYQKLRSENTKFLVQKLHKFHFEKNEPKKN